MQGHALGVAEDAQSQVHLGVILSEAKDLYWQGRFFAPLRMTGWEFAWIWDY